MIVSFGRNPRYFSCAMSPRNDLAVALTLPLWMLIHFLGCVSIKRGRYEESTLAARENDRSSRSICLGVAPSIAAVSRVIIDSPRSRFPSRPNRAPLEGGWSIYDLWK